MCGRRPETRKNHTYFVEISSPFNLVTFNWVSCQQPRYSTHTNCKGLPGAFKVHLPTVYVINRGYYICAHDKRCLLHECLDYNISRARAREIS